jgi:hypothetical protein
MGRWLFRLLGLVVPSDKLWQLIDVSGIVVFVGPNGSGKSLAAVASCLTTLGGVGWDCIDVDHRHHSTFREHIAGCEECSAQLWRFRRASVTADLAPFLCPGGLDALAWGDHGERFIYSTVVLLDDDGRDHERFRPLVDYRQLIALEHCDVLFDEVAGVSDASDSGAVPVQVVNWLHQLRKRDVRLRVTTPAYSRCSKPIRQVAQVVVDARSFFPVRRASGRLWRPRQGFIFVAYDAFAFEDFTSATVRAAEGQKRKTRMGRAVLWRPGSEAERRYNTLGQVLALGHVTESGMCSNCGGTRAKPKCACDVALDDHQAYEIEEKVERSGARVRRAVPVPGLTADEFAAEVREAAFP